MAEALSSAGAKVDESARPEFDPDYSHEIYGRLLHSTMAARMPDGDYESLKKHVDELDPGDQSEVARTQRAQVSKFQRVGSGRMSCVTAFGGSGTIFLKTTMYC